MRLRPHVCVVGRRLHSVGGPADSARPALRRCSGFPPQKQVASAPSAQWRMIVIYTLAMVLLVLWVLGLVTSFTAGGLLHILLVAAVIMVVYQLVTGRSVG